MEWTKGRKMAVMAWCIIIAVIIADQALKIWIKTHFYLNEDYEIASWFHIHFIQNNGMAFGLEFFNKYVLTFFRLTLFCVLVWYIRNLCRKPSTPTGYLVCIALIAAGAFGNIVDCVCYGMIFTNPYPPFVAQLVPWGQGYGSMFQGLVVDMFYFPLFSFTWPSWLPFIGGNRFSFFDPVFNIADVAICVGMISILVFYFKRMEHFLDNEKDKDSGNS